MRIAVLTTGRQDWGIVRSTCLALRTHPTLSLSLWSGGMHEHAAFGASINDILADGFVVDEHLGWLDGPGMSATAQAAGALEAVAGALTRRTPDALLLTGDRLETAAAALAGTLCAIPIVHLHGGEETEGAFDNALRHAVTKQSHLHLVSHEKHAARVRAMGEDPATIHVVGAPGLDNLRRHDLPTRDELARALGDALEPPVVVVTLHPTTLGADPSIEARAVVAAMNLIQATYVITLPNSDPGAEQTRAILVAAARHERRVVVEALGERRFWGLLRIADAMVGNSSSALVEAPALDLPAVNVGDRQRGRERGNNVLDTDASADQIAAALRRALGPALRASLRGSPRPFGDGKSAQKIVAVLERWSPPRPPRKRFVLGAA